VVHALARSLISKGHEVCVVTNKYPRSLPKKETQEGVSIRRLHFLRPRIDDIRRRRPDLFIASLYFLPAAHFELDRIVQSFRPDVINVHYPDVQVPYVLRLRRRFDFRLVVSLHGHDVERYSQADGVNHSERGSLISLLRHSNGVTACSDYLLNQAAKLESSVRDTGSVVFNGIDLERFKVKSVYPHPRPYVLAIGRLTHAKGFDLLLEAFSQLNGRGSETDLIIAGDGELRDSLELRARELGLNGKVHFFGEAKPEEIVRLLNGSLFVVVPSRQEAFGLAALEAMAAGKPVLATRVGGLQEFLDESHNKLVEPSIAGITSGLVQWLDAQEELTSLGSENRKLAARYTWARTAEGYLNAYEESQAAPLEEKSLAFAG
jgi:glycosyltransferase involved in cell wall biosynthesis